MYDFPVVQKCCPPYSYQPVDIVLFRDEANVAVPRRGPRVYVQPLGENLEDTIEQELGVFHATSDPTYTTSGRVFLGSQ